MGGVGRRRDGLGRDAEAACEGGHPATVAVARDRDTDAGDEPSTWAGGDGVSAGPEEAAGQGVLPC
eukprot:1374500-Rhodomonas_salina.1